jgi:hypothetical protein
MSGIGPLVEERKRIEEELEAVAKEVCSLDASRPANAALQAAALLAVKLAATITTTERLQRSSRRSWTSLARRRPNRSAYKQERAAFGPPFLLRRLRRSFSFATNNDMCSTHFVTSMTAPVASGWSVRRVGFAPTGKRRLLTAHANSGRSRHGAANRANRPEGEFACTAQGRLPS